MELKSTSSKGGAREGAGRKALGITRKVSITMPEEEWILLDALQAENKIRSLSEHFRALHMCETHSTAWWHLYLDYKFDRDSKIAWK